ncbi:MAG TPA: hypothetical protein VMC83_13085 [Streptosporangiaceae bacterium]|nr:hypothetical protein [Streptosporangiaceae bacterium]
MTGSALAPVVIPIVAFAFLILWIGMVFYANAHPSVHGREARAAHEEHQEHEAVAGEDSAQDRPGTNRRAA